MDQGRARLSTAIGVGPVLNGAMDSPHPHQGGKKRKKKKIISLLYFFRGRGGKRREGGDRMVCGGMRLCVWGAKKRWVTMIRDFL